jgi:3-hydroxyacyl-[acyl-carrier-protein] dehydratase
MSDPITSADIQLIQRIIPHRYPFLLVDKVVDIDGTTSATGHQERHHERAAFSGVSGTPIMPGVTIIEARWHRHLP